MKVTFPAILFPTVIQVLLKTREQDLKGNINYALTRILTALQPDWKAFSDIRDPLIKKYQDIFTGLHEQYKDNEEGLKQAIKANDDDLNAEYNDTFKDQEIEVDIRPLKEEWLDDMKIAGNDGDIIAMFIEQDTIIEVVK